MYGNQTQPSSLGLGQYFLNSPIDVAFLATYTFGMNSAKQGVAQMATMVQIIQGTYRGEEIRDQQFELVEGLKSGKSGRWITVNNTDSNGFPQGKIRIKVTDEACFSIEETEKPEEVQETEEEVVARIRKRFQILDDMTRATGDGIIRGLIVSGPPGIGKSFGIEKIITQFDVNARMLDLKSKFGVERGAASAIGVYKMLYEYSEEGSVLVLDDSDSILYDETTLGLLKAVLDSTKKRRVSWKSESRVLENESIPNSFEFKGSVIFITNLKLESTRGKIGQHMEAILSRCHYVDLTINNTREKFLRCKQIVQDGMLREYGFINGEQFEILDFIENNQFRIREISLRMVKKIADLRKMDATNWVNYAEATCLR